MDRSNGMDRMDGCNRGDHYGSNRQYWAHWANGTNWFHWFHWFHWMDWPNRTYRANRPPRLSWITGCAWSDR